MTSATTDNAARMLALLARHADQAGVVRLDPGEVADRLDLTRTAASEAWKVLQTACAADRPRRNGAQVFRVLDAEWRPARDPAGRPGPPKGSRACTDQARHHSALWGSRYLREDPYVLLVALAIHRRIGVQTARSGGFGSRAVPYKAELIAADTGMSARKAKEAAARAVDLEFYRRADDHKGGRRGKGTAAAYVPTLPAGWSR